MNYQGLTKKDVEVKRVEAGYNELPSSKPRNILTIVVDVFKEPMFVLLVSCALLYMLVGDYMEGMILLGSIFIVISITIFQSRKTEHALTALKNLSSPRALVLRNGEAIRIAARELVPDDVIVLHEGDRIAADALLLESAYLSIDESLLTGESIPVLKDEAGSKDYSNSIFSGTLVVQGTGIAKVIATGLNTRFGQIGRSLLLIQPEPTRLQVEMKILIRKLFIIGGFICIGVVVTFYLTRGDFIQALMNGLASSMAILPEEFPVVLTIFLSLGAWRLSKQNVLTRTPSAIETLGSATVLCSDKTGTITQNKMGIAGLFDGVTTCLSPAIADNAITFQELIETFRLASSEAPIDPMEKAILQFSKDYIPQPADKPVLLKDYPFDKAQMAMAKVYSTIHKQECTVFAKGAPESIFGLCRLSLSEGGDLKKVMEDFGQKGFRVLGVAKAECGTTSLPEEINGFHFRFAGLIGFEDPIRTEVPSAIRQCHEAGIRVIMITGDHAITARSIASLAGLPVLNTMIGAELEALSDEELRQKMNHVNVCARIVPEQKLRIVNALKANNEIVAMTGDGVNDAPALKAAHIGIAMGNKGTDVAREASSLVLLDDNFASIVSAIRAGRKIFDNLEKAMNYIMAIHIPIIGLVLLPAFFTSLPILLMPLHIVFMELIIDPACSLGFEAEQEELGIMNRPPKDPTVKFFGANKILRSVFQGLLLLGVVTAVYFWSIHEKHSEGEIRAITFSTLIIANVFLILSDLSKTKNFFKILFRKNYTAILIIVGASIVLSAVLFMPALNRVFNFENPGYSHFWPSLLGAGIMLLVLEIVKKATLLKSRETTIRNPAA